MNIEFDLLDCTRSPLILHDSSWADVVPSRIRELVTPARLAAAYKDEHLATYPEVACYLMTRSAVAPMDSEWTDIYTHVTCVMMEQYFKEDHWKTLGAQKQLSRNNQEMLDRLRLHIYESRRKFLKNSLKQKHAKV